VGNLASHLGNVEFAANPYTWQLLRSNRSFDPSSDLAIDASVEV